MIGMRRLVLTLLALLLCALPATAAEPMRIVIDHRPLFLAPEEQPFIQNDRTLIPFRALLERLGARVDWDGPTGTVRATKGETVIQLTIDAPVAYVNGKAVQLDQPATLVGDRTFVPLRFVSEALGAHVTWLEPKANEPWNSAPTVAITTYPVEPAPLTTTPAPTALQVTRLARGEELVAAGEGIFFLNLATGAVEGYAVPGAEPYTVGYAASPDGRFVIARTIESGYLLDRQTGQTHRWDHLQYDLVTVGADRLLFQAVLPQPEQWATSADPTDGRLGGYLQGTARYVVTGLDLKPVREFTLPGGEAPPTTGDDALFSPAGDRLILARDGQTYLVDLATGQSRPIGPGARLEPVKGGSEVLALTESEQSTLVRRYSWQGDLVVESQVPARGLWPSPDGEWVAWESFVAGFAPVVYVARLGEEGKPLRAPGATMCWDEGGVTGARWTDRQHLLVRTSEGMRQIGTDGSVTTLRRPADWTYFSPEPGPNGLTSFSRWTEAGRVVGALTPAGEVAAAVTIRGNGYGPERRNQYWGATPTEIRFVMRLEFGHDGACGDYAIPLPMQVQAPGTYAPGLTLQVKAPGDCVNVREEPWFEARIITCLPDGTRIPLGEQQSRGLPSFHHNEDGQWFKLPEGWIRVSSGLLQFAP
jgi:hypothetical protein